MAFHNNIELQLADGGSYRDVRDVASKIADNAVRIAALFQVSEHGLGDTIELEAFVGAARIATWHLRESRRFFGELALPAELADAVRLDRWLIGFCSRAGTAAVAKNHVRQHGPLRDGVRLDKAIKELTDLQRLRIAKNVRLQTIELNPALLGAANQYRTVDSRSSEP